MAAEHTARRYGKVFDGFAEEYDRNRITYPEALVDRVCAAAGLARGAEVLEIGCGTGQLTRSLVARGLRVTAVEPGPRLISLAAANTRGAGSVEFVQARLEDAVLPVGHFAAAFSASAFHWTDPDVSWRKVAEALVPGGTFSLIQYFGVHDPDCDDDALRAVMAGVVPQIVAEMSPPRELDALLAGVHQRRGNLSQAWAWLGGYDLARNYAVRLFSEIEIATVPVVLEQSAAELNAFFRTTSLHARLSPDEREALERATLELGERLRRPLRSSTVAVALTARRSAPSPPGDRRSSRA